jgi:hypothetical protein
MFNINDIFDNINDGLEVIGSVFSGEWESCDVFDGVVVLSDLEGHDVYVDPKNNVIVGWRCYGCSLNGIDKIS